MRRYEIQRKSRAPKPWPWERLFLRELPTRGPGSVIAPRYPGGPFQRLRDHVRNMKPGEIIHLGVSARVRVVNR